MIRDKIKQIKYLRLKPEERFLLEQLEGLESFTLDKYPESIFWEKNGVVIFEQDFKNGWLRCNYDKIWSVFSYKYGYNYDDTQSFMKRVIEKDTKLNGLTPRAYRRRTKALVDKDTKLSGLTPDLYSVTAQGTVENDTKLNGLTPYRNISINEIMVEKDTKLSGLIPIDGCIYPKIRI